MRNLEIVRIEKQGKQKISVSALYIVRYISDRKPGILVINLGESDFIIEYKPPEPERKWVEILKAGLVGIIIFFGSAFTIMTFHNDVGILDVFDVFYEQLMGVQKPKITELEISYSIGLAVGIVVFFNHFSKRKITTDPTPIDVEMKKYNKDLINTKIAESDEKGHTIDVS